MDIIVYIHLLFAPLVKYSVNALLK